MMKSMILHSFQITAKQINFEEKYDEQNFLLSENVKIFIKLYDFDD
jgi:hypothetical protein